MRSLWTIFRRHCQREIWLCKRQPRLMLQSWVFYWMMLLFFPLTLSPDTTLLNEVASGIVWIALLFVVILLSEGWFQRAFEEGVIEQIWVSGEPMVLMVLAVMAVQWFLMITALAVLFPIVWMLYALNVFQTSMTLLGFILGSPSLFLLAAFAAVLNVGRVQKTSLMALLVLPLSIPVMVFGSGVVKLNAMQGSVSGLMAFLSACSLLCVGGLPFAITAVLRLRFEDG